MGLFSKLTGALTGGLVGDDPFKFARTGATAAARDAKTAGQQTLDEQRGFFDEMRSGYAPAIEQGNTAATSLADFYGGNTGAIVSQAQNSPFFDAMQSTGEQSVLRNQALTGGFRSGTTQENLAGNSQNVLMSLVQQILGGQSQVADRGSNAQNNFANFGGNMISGMGGTRGQMANVDIAQAAGRQNMFSGLLGAGATVLGGG